MGGTNVSLRLKPDLEMGGRESAWESNSAQSFARRCNRRPGQVQVNREGRTVGDSQLVHMAALPVGYAVSFVFLSLVFMVCI